MGTITFPFGCKDFESALDMLNTSDGRYALGASSFWHGGVHLTLSKDTQAILSPADGEIIAHRTMKKRTTGKASITVDNEGNKISEDKDEDVDSSFSFVLSRHTFKTPKKQDIVYYILHMHLLCYENYKDIHKLRPPPYLYGDVQYFVKKGEDDGGSLVGKGLNLRASPSSRRNNVLTVIKKDTEFEFEHRGSYDHTTSKAYFNVVIKNPQKFTLSKAYLSSGSDAKDKLRLLPVEKYYSDHGVLYRAQIISASESHIGVPLYINSCYVGDLIKGQEVYFKEKSAYEGSHELILDNIMNVVKPNAEGKLTVDSFFDGWTDNSSILVPTKDDLVSLEEALLAAGLCMDDDLTALAKVRPENAFGTSGKIRYIKDYFSKLKINTYESNQCGIPAYDSASGGSRLIDIPHSRFVELVTPISIDELASSQGAKHLIKPITIEQPKEGVVFCSNKYVEQKINEVTGKFDSIEVFKEPIPIYSGDVIGYPGNHEKQNIVHMELWLDNIDFFKNSEKDQQYEDKVDLPSGLTTKIQKIEISKCKPEQQKIPAKGTMKFVSRVKDLKKKPTIRKVKYNEKEYFVYYKDIKPYWSTTKNAYYFKDETELTLYPSHPEIEIETITYSDSTLTQAVSLEPMPRMMSAEEKDYFPVSSKEETTEQGRIKEIVLIAKEEVNKYREDYYNWEKFFHKTSAANLGFEKSGYYESKKDIENQVLEEYKALSENKSMINPPSYQKSHPLSHLIIESGTEWSKSQKDSSGWSDGVIEYLWKKHNVSSLEEDAGITKASVKKVFDQTLKEYSDEISFFDDVKASVSSLPDKSKVLHAHPLRFLGHINQLDQVGPPWMQFARQQMKEYGGVRQTQSPLKEQIFKYFDSSSYPEGTNKTNWCAAFIHWCFEQTDDFKGSNPNANVAAFDWLPKSLARKHRKDVDGWNNSELIESIDDVFVGAVIVFSHSHVAFVAGQSEDGKSLIYLGGNQSDGKPGDGKGKRTICTNPKSKSSFNKKYWLVKPKNYQPTSADMNLPILSPDGKELGYADTHG